MCDKTQRGFDGDFGAFSARALTPERRQNNNDDVVTLLFRVQPKQKSSNAINETSKDASR